MSVGMYARRYLTPAAHIKNTFHSGAAHGYHPLYHTFLPYANNACSLFVCMHFLYFISWYPDVSGGSPENAVSLPEILSDPSAHGTELPGFQIPLWFLAMLPDSSDQVTLPVSRAALPGNPSPQNFLTDTPDTGLHKLPFGTFRILVTLFLRVCSMEHC